MGSSICSVLQCSYLAPFPGLTQPLPQARSWLKTCSGCWFPFHPRNLPPGACQKCPGPSRFSWVPDPHSWASLLESQEYTAEPAPCLFPMCLCLRSACLAHAPCVSPTCLCVPPAGLAHAPWKQARPRLLAHLSVCGGLLLGGASPPARGRGFRVLRSRCAGGSQGIAGLPEVLMG